MSGEARRGRRPGNPETSRTIVQVAHRLFTEHGDQATSLRQVAREAGVDPKLVRHYFADKTALFLAAVQIEVDPRRLVGRIAEGGLPGAGERIVATALRLWSSSFGANLIAVANHRPGLLQIYARLMGEAIKSAADDVLAEIPAGERRIRVALIESLMAGLLTGRYLSGMEPVASLPDAVVVRRWGPIVQRILETGG